MAKSQKSKSSTDQEFKTSEFNFPFGNFEEMMEKMQNFCSEDKGSFDCCAMMQQMRGTKTNEPEKQ